MTTTPDPVKALRAALTEKLHINLRTNPVKVALDGDSILMEGFVERISQKKRALFMAMGMEGVKGVIDRLRVRPSARMSDAEVKKHVEDAFAGESTLSGMGLSAEVRGGVVDIEGSVPSLSHKRLAGALAWWVPGSTDVINSIEVDPPEEDSGDEVAEALGLVLEKDRLVDATAITITVKDWVATLGGLAGSEAERNAAEDDAWYIWGVNDVVNNIKVEAAGIHQLP